jgi:FkbM family methyltransferase
MKISTFNTILSPVLSSKHKIKTLTRFFKWSLVKKFNKNSFDFNYVGNTKLRVKKGFSSAELQYYCGLYDFAEMGFLLHFLRKEDIFIDVGANIGVYTLLASGHIGAYTIAYEPVPSTFEYLEENIQLNNLQHNCELKNIGVSDKIGLLKFTNKLGAENHVISDNKVNDTCIEVPVDTLDNTIDIKNPALIKIDVEGFETMVINGAFNTLKKTSLKAIIIELNGLSNAFGFDEQKIHERILLEGFSPYTYDPFLRKLTLLSACGNDNTIYLRDIENIKERIKSAPIINIFGSSF